MTDFMIYNYLDVETELINGVQCGPEGGQDGGGSLFYGEKNAAAE